MHKLFIVFIISAMLYGGGFYFNSNTPKYENTPDQIVVTAPQFDSIEEYIDLLLEPATSTKYYIKYRPDGLVEAYATEVMLDGVESVATVLAKNGWDKKGIEEIQIFYIEIGDAESEEYLPYYYGPFKGKLRKLVNK